MTTLVIGGAGSGKSAFAERLLCTAVPHGRRFYIAAMEPFGDEGRRRIERHRALRAGKGFETVERYVNLAGLDLPPDGAALLECVGNLCANELYSPQGSGDGAEKAVIEGVRHLSEQCRELVIVSNEVCVGGTAYLGDTLRYLRLMGRVNQALAAMADNVCEVVCGVPVYCKGEGPS